MFCFPGYSQHGVELPPPRAIRKKPKPSTSRAKEAEEPAQPHTEDTPEEQAEKSKKKAHEVSPGLKQRDGVGCASVELLMSDAS